MILDKLFDSVVNLLMKVLPEGKKQEVLLAIETIRAKSKQPLTISIIAILQLLIFQGKSIFYRIEKIVYFNTTEWWIDVILMAMIFSFLFSIPFSEVIKALKDKPK